MSNDDDVRGVLEEYRRFALLIPSTSCCMWTCDHRVFFRKHKQTVLGCQENVPRPFRKSLVDALPSNRKCT